MQTLYGGLFSWKMEQGHSPPPVILFWLQLLDWSLTKALSLTHTNQTHVSGLPHTCSLFFTSYLWVVSFFLFFYRNRCGIRSHSKSIHISPNETLLHTYTHTEFLCRGPSQSPNHSVTPPLLGSDFCFCFSSSMYFSVNSSMEPSAGFLSFSGKMSGKVNVWLWAWEGEKQKQKNENEKQNYNDLVQTHKEFVAYYYNNILFFVVFLLLQIRVKIAHFFSHPLSIDKSETDFECRTFSLSFSSSSTNTLLLWHSISPTLPHLISHLSPFLWSWFIQRERMVSIIYSILTHLQPWLMHQWPEHGLCQGCCGEQWTHGHLHTYTVKKKPKKPLLNGSEGLAKQACTKRGHVLFLLRKDYSA